nr:MAG TPA_asm: hypothetical protein [Caudoviricetes sp.]
MIVKISTSLTFFIISINKFPSRLVKPIVRYGSTLSEYHSV